VHPQSLARHHGRRSGAIAIVRYVVLSRIVCRNKDSKDWRDWPYFPAMAVSLPDGYYRILAASMM